MYLPDSVRRHLLHACNVSVEFCSADDDLRLERPAEDARHDSYRLAREWWGDWLAVAAAGGGPVTARETWGEIGAALEDEIRALSGEIDPLIRDLEEGVLTEESHRRLLDWLGTDAPPVEVDRRPCTPAERERIERRLLSLMHSRDYLDAKRGVLRAFVRVALAYGLCSPLHELLARFEIEDAGAEPFGERRRKVLAVSGDGRTRRRPAFDYLLTLHGVFLREEQSGRSSAVAKRLWEKVTPEHPKPDGEPVSATAVGRQLQRWGFVPKGVRLPAFRDALVVYAAEARAVEDTLREIREAGRG